MTIAEDRKLENFYCKDHPITRNSDVIISFNETISLSIEHRREANEDDKDLKQVAVHNGTGETLWVQVDSRIVRKTNNSNNISGNIKILGASIGRFPL